MLCILVNNTLLLVFLNTFSPLLLSMSCNTFHHLALKQFFFFTFFFTLVILAVRRLLDELVRVACVIVYYSETVQYTFFFLFCSLFSVLLRSLLFPFVFVSRWISRQYVCCLATSWVLYMNCMHIVKHCGIICSFYIAVMSECFWN